MSGAGSQLPPLLINWSTGSVSVFDPSTRAFITGGGLDECLNGHTAGREAVVAVSQRSAFIRCVQVPPLSKQETAQILSLKLTPLMPLEPGEYVFGFRLGANVAGQGRTAVVGAVKTSTLRTIDRDCAAHGIKIRAVLPLAFGSWLAAREKLLLDGAVVESDGARLNVDVVSEGELRYSRSVPLPENRAGIEDEIARSFEIAEVVPGPVLTTGEGIEGGEAGSRSALEYLSDPSVIDRLLFSLELPESIESRRTKALGKTVQRAILSAVAAAVLAGAAIRSQTTHSALAAKAEASMFGDLAKAQSDQTAAVSRNLEAQDQRLLVGQAFHPAQSFSDVLGVASDRVPKDIWLTGFTLERGKSIVIRGAAMNSRAAARYAARLSQEPRFRHMKLVFANRAMAGHTQIVEFAVSGHVVGNLPIDQVPKEGSKP